MSSIEERLTVRMELAMKAMMESMAKMHREFGEQMRRERQVMKTEIETLLSAQLGIMVTCQTQGTELMTPTQITAPVTVQSYPEPALSLESPTATPSISVVSNISPVPKAKTTTVASPTSEKTTLQPPTPSAKTILPGVTSSKNQLSRTSARPKQAEYIKLFSSDQATSDKDPQTMRSVNPNRVKVKPPAQTSHIRDSHPDRWAVANHGARSECALKASESKVSRIAPCTATPEQAYDMARKLESLGEPRTKALKREDAIKILRVKSMVNLPDVHEENTERYNVAIARLAQSVEHETPNLRVWAFPTLGALKICENQI